MEFSAVQVPQKAAHTYRNDLESFLYVLRWIYARRTWEVKFSVPDVCAARAEYFIHRRF